jgi:hypothetical protein
MNHATPKNPRDDPEPAVISEVLVPGDVIVGTSHAHFAGGLSRLAT